MNLLSIRRCLLWPPWVRLIGGVGLALTLATLTAAELKWQNANGFRWAALPVEQGGRNGFIVMPADKTGLSFTNLLDDERSITNRNLLSGSGVALGDVDGDGRCDVYFCRLDGDNVLYRNLGNWTFEDITKSAGVACPGVDAMGACLADIDGDGDLDLLVNGLGTGTRIFQNDGKGQFKEITDTAGVRSATGSTSLTLADIDGDGDLDLYVANFRPTTVKDRPTTHFRGQLVNGRPVIVEVDGRPTSAPDLTNRFEVTPSGNVLEYGEPDVLYRNEGYGRFSAVSFTDGTFLDEQGKPLSEPPRDWGLAAQFHDFTGDGAPDLYVCNDLFTPDRIWVNDGTGKFRAIPRLALRSTSTFSMGVDFGDLDRDGQVDFFVVDMLSRVHQDRAVQVAGSSSVVWPVGVIENRPQLNRNTLQYNRGDGTFAEIAYYAGVEASEWSWGPILLDVDLDGFEDILITNGQLRDFQNADLGERLEKAQARGGFSSSDQVSLMKSFPRLNTPNVLFRNRGDLTFEEISAAWGFAAKGISQGMALADLDGDGDLDVVMNNLNGVCGVYRNVSSAPRVAVRLKGLPPNTRGIGAKIWMYGGAVQMQSQEMICGGRYLSSDDALRVFAAGSLTNDMRIEVKWRNGKRSVVNAVKANRIYEIDEAGAEESSKLKAQSSREAPSSGLQAPSPTIHESLFEDVSRLLGHVHQEEQFDDFGRQPLLPRKFSQLGPGVGWWDADGDGWEDLVIGSGKGGELAVYRSDGKGNFERMNAAPMTRAVSRDQTSVLGTEGGLMVGWSNYEDGLTNGGCVKIYDLTRNVSGESILGQAFSPGPLALADLDHDGDLDLFVGGRVVVGRYPEPAASLVLRNEGGRLVVGQQLEKVGLVSGAVFSDVNGDGEPDLVLACEWGPLKVFRNESGTLKEITKDLGLDRYVGWWNGVTAGDFDEDGKLDLVASNWGLNSRYRTSREHPRKIYYGDFGTGGVDVIEAYYEPTMKTEVPDRDLRAVGAALPWVRESVGTFEAYGKSSLASLYGNRLQTARVVEVNTLETMIFLNRGDHFEARALPREAQWAPAFGVSVGDVDGDGHEDIFLSQNFFAVSPDQGRNDAGRGLWLRGDGHGNFSAVPGQESGVKVYGEQRGCALCDYDADGRVDLVVTQNGAETKLYHNRGARPGLRVRLKGAPGNPTGVGAVVRLRFGDRFGPAREVHAGSGYWSQDSAVQVLATLDPPTHIHVRWPDGRNTSSPVPPSTTEIAVDQNGSVQVSK